jgi:hypothetical protein
VVVKLKPRKEAHTKPLYRCQPRCHRPNTSNGRCWERRGSFWHVCYERSFCAGFVLCAQAGPWYDHTLGCAEDGSLLFEECNTAIEFCSSCFPFSRCGRGTSFVPNEGEEEEEEVGGLMTEDSPEDEATSDAHRLGGRTTVWWILALMILW